MHGTICFEGKGDNLAQQFIATVTKVNMADKWHRSYKCCASSLFISWPTDVLNFQQAVNPIGGLWSLYGCHKISLSAFRIIVKWTSVTKSLLHSITECCLLKCFWVCGHACLALAVCRPLVVVSVNLFCFCLLVFLLFKKVNVGHAVL